MYLLLFKSAKSCYEFVLIMDETNVMTHYDIILHESFPPAEQCALWDKITSAASDSQKRPGNKLAVYCVWDCSETVEKYMKMW